MDKNPLAAQAQPDYQKMDYIYDSAANFFDIIPSGAINVGGLNSSNILSKANPARVNEQGIVLEGGDIVFQIPLSQKFMTSKRNDKQIVIRAIWFFLVGDNTKIATTTDYKNAIKLSFEVSEMNHILRTITTQTVAEDTYYQTTQAEAHTAYLEYSAERENENIGGNSPTTYHLVQYQPVAGPQSKRNVATTTVAKPADTTTTYSGETYGTMVETVEISCPKDTTFSPSNTFPFGAYNKYSGSGNFWHFICKRFLLTQDDDAQFTKTYVGPDITIPLILADRNGTTTDAYYYYPASQTFQITKSDNTTIDLRWSKWICTEASELLSGITEVDGVIISTKNKINDIETAIPNAYPSVITNQINQQLSPVNCPVVSTLTSTISSYGSTAMMTNTPYDHPTQTMISTLPYFLVGFSKGEGTELYTIPAGKSYREYCRCVVEMTLLY